MPKVDRLALSERAWALLEEAVATGTVTLAGRAKPYELDTRETVQVLQWLANQSSNKLRKPIERGDQFVVPKTES